MNRSAALLSGLLSLAVAFAAAAGEVALEIQPDRVLNAIDEKVYGHFLEHIYHSVNGGLWGELIWNRSFEENEAGQWSVAGGSVVQQGPGANQRLTFGDPAWRDYDFTLEARKTGGNEGFLILFRVKSENEFYWCNLGGWGNVRHSLERGRAGAERWRPVGPRVDGRIETGRWYRIRVRCQGPQITVWLDDRPLVDFTDDEGHLGGKVGVGTWATQAEFRNLKVTSPDGQVLFEGLPEDLAAPSLARHWRLVGGGSAAVDRADPLNSGFSQKIIGAVGKQAGIEQMPLNLRSGETYAGSVWLRGEAPGGVCVRLVDAAGTLAEQRLPGPSAAWQEYPVELAVSRDAPEAAVQILLDGEGEVWIDQVSLMPQSWRRAGGFRPDLVDAIAALRPPVIRWPGGCFASAYRWQDGIGPQYRRGVYPRLIWDDLDVNSFGTDEFVALCRKVGAEPLIVVNIGTAHWNGEVDRKVFVREVCDWIEYCNGPADSTWGKVRAANGHAQPYGVKYWEIDNETWHMGAEEYAEAVRVFAPAMKKADPSIELAACGSGGYRADARGLEWNRILIERTADLIDYLSIHHYENPDNFQQGPAAYEEFFRRTAGLIAASNNPGVKIYVSEWNAQSTDWRTGLYCGGLLNAFERCGDVLTIGGPALFLRHVSADRWDNAFVNFDHKRWFPAPNYVVMKLWREHYAPARIAIEGDCGGLNAVATRSADGRTVHFKAVNPSEEAVRVTLTLAGGFAPSAVALEQIAPGSLQARNTLDDPAAVRPRRGTAEIDGRQVRLEMPRLSAAVVTITRDEAAPPR